MGNQDVQWESTHVTWPLSMHSYMKLPKGNSRTNGNCQYMLTIGGYPWIGHMTVDQMGVITSHGGRTGLLVTCSTRRHGMRWQEMACVAGIVFFWCID